MNDPFEAVEEALANAVYHKSYELASPIEVQVWPDRIEILSFPGPVPPLTATILEQRRRIVARGYRNRRVDKNALNLCCTVFNNYVLSCFLKMKITASILIVLLFVMAFAPCGDASEIGMPLQVEQISEVNITGEVDFQYQADKQQEECSPICPCQCCPSIDSDAIALSEITSIAPPSHTAEEKLSISLAVSFLIWSPPQLLS